MQTYGTLAKVGDTQLNVYTEGSGSITIVFLAGSGVGCPGYEYKPVYRRLSDRLRIAVVEKVAPDTPSTPSVLPVSTIRSQYAFMAPANGVK